MMTTRLPRSADRGVTGIQVALLGFVRPRKVFHRLVYAVELAARNRQVAPLGGAPRQHESVKAGLQLGGRNVDTHLDSGAELCPLGAHLVEPSLDVALLHLELRDAVAQQAAEAVGTLEHGDVVPGPGELLSGGQSGRT